VVRFITFLLLFASFQVSAQKPTIKNGLKSFMRDRIIYPLYAQNNCIQGTVELAFKLNQHGEVTYATVTKSVGADLDEEALRLIKLSSGKWQMPPNYDTTALVRSPIKFSLEGFGCEKNTQANVGLALVEYNAQMQDIKKVISYYENKDLDVELTLNAEEVKKLIEKLAFSEGYFEKRVSIAERKILQGSLESGCQDLKFVKYMGSDKADRLLLNHCQ
jgi:TonB family protein